MALLELDAAGNVLVADQTDLNGASAGGTSNPYPAGVTPMTVAQQLAEIALGANTIAQMEADFDQFMVDRQGQVDLALAPPHVHGDGGVGSQILNVKSFSFNSVGSGFVHIKLPVAFKFYSFVVLSNIWGEGSGETRFSCYVDNGSFDSPGVSGDFYPEFYVGSDGFVYARMTISNFYHFSLSVNSVAVMRPASIPDCGLIEIQALQVEYL